MDTFESVPDLNDLFEMQIIVLYQCKVECEFIAGIVDSTHGVGARNVQLGDLIQENRRWLNISYLSNSVTN